MISYYFTIFIITFILGVISAFFTKKAAIKLGIVDKPDQERKFHKEAIPLMGGVAIFITIFIMFYFVRNNLLSGELKSNHWLGVFLGSIFLLIGGVLDDKYNLKPLRQIIWPVLACLAVIFGGVNIAKITNPFGGFLYFSTFFSGFIIFLWLMGMMYTTKLLDGVDGLVSGVTAIGGLIIFLFTMTTKYYQPDIGLAALILAGTCLGFLILNWYPAKIFLGESGSLLLGFILGVLAIISGGKIAIALLIMGLPILDVAWTIIQRIKAGKNPFRFADRKHLHFRLLDIGLSPRQTVIIYYFFSSIFGLSALFLQSVGKVLALVILFIIMIGIIIGFSYLEKKKINL